jgi:Tat protein secretion system quality control protein TatD with DNase activity
MISLDRRHQALSNCLRRILTDEVVVETDARWLSTKCSDEQKR